MQNSVQLHVANAGSVVIANVVAVVVSQYSRVFNGGYHQRRLSDS